MDLSQASTPFEVVFRGSDNDFEDPLQMNELVPSTSTDTSDLEAVSLSTGKLQKLSPTMSGTEGTSHPTESHVFQLEENSPLRETSSDPFRKPRWWREASSLSLIIASMIIFCIGITVALIVQSLVGAPQVIPHAGVLSDDPKCSEIGIRVLTESSASTYPTASSVDAAILTALCLITKNPHKGGLGGGGFMIVEKQHDVSKDTTRIDFREMSPQSTDSSLNLPRDQIKSELTVTVPGFFSGIKKAHSLFGKAPFQDILTLAAEMASKPVNVSKELASAIQDLDLNSVSPDLRNLVTKADNTTKLVENDQMNQTQLAHTFTILGKTPDSFYNGTIAKAIVDTVNGRGGNLALSDMSGYRVISDKDVLKIKYSDMSIVSAGPTSAGPVVLSTLNSLNHYLSKENSSDSKLMYHRMLEALKFSHGHRTEWADSSDVTSSFSNQFTIDDNKSYNITTYLNGSQPLRLNTGAEQHVTVIGYDGLVVTLVMSLGTPFGSKIMTSGFVLNNAILDFSWPGKNPDDTTGLPPSQANRIGPNKRPMSAMAPILVLPSGTKCGLYLTFDAHEGTTAISAVTQTIIRKVEGSTLTVGINEGRLNQDMVPYSVEAEASTPVDLTNYLSSLGHHVTRLPAGETLGVSNVLSYETGVVKSYSDTRDDDNQASVF